MEDFHREYNPTIVNSNCSQQVIFPASTVDDPIQDPPYLQLWTFEKGTQQNAWAQWHKENWHLAPLASAIYLVTIFSIRRAMASRTPFALRNALVLWNAVLAIFSVIGFFRSSPEMVFVLGKVDGLYESICRRDQRNSATAFWGVAIGLSKMVELGDTLFIVLRKQPLIFLHYYHHVTVLCYIWLTADAINSTCTWFGVMNYGVHSLMYSYYALKALQVKVPRNIAMSITALQLAQMVVGVGVNVYVLVAKYAGRACATETTHVYFALLMYGSYFVLFAHFFYGAYLKRRKLNHHFKSE